MRAHPRFGLKVVALVLALTSSPPQCLLAETQPKLYAPKSELSNIAKKIWHNESAGQKNGLTAWNRGENFASLGIAHFIWYPQGSRGPFEESFPGLVAHLRGRGVPVPKWLLAARFCPWDSRSKFLADFNSSRMEELRSLLLSTVDYQVEYAVMRLEDFISKIKKDIPPGESTRLQNNFRRVVESDGGLYALVDYVNFKGDGFSASERHRGQGWGLLQVLSGMSGAPDPIDDFVKSARRTLTRRVELSSAASSESRWLKGWLSRISTYNAR